MSASKEFFRERRAQAVLKHGILQRYPTIFASKTGARGRRVVLLDGYAGRGQYEDGSPGSPLLLARTAQRLADFRDVTCVYVEENEADFANLQQVMDTHGRETDLLLHGDLRTHLPRILQLAQGTALFAFLDPFGTALDRGQLVGDLLCRPGGAPVEVLLHLSVSTVARLGGLLRRRREQGVEVLDQRDAKSIAHVDRFLGGDWWQEHFAAPLQGEGEEERVTTVALRVAALFQNDVCTAARFRAVSVPVRRRPTQTPIYVLVLFTRHADGAWFFADTLGKAGCEWQGAWRTEVASHALLRAKKRYGDEGLFDLEELFTLEPFDLKRYEQQHREQWQATIESNIRNLLATRGRFRLPDHVVHVYGTTLGEADARHVRMAVKALHAAGEIANTGVGKYFFRELIVPVN